MGSAVYWKHSRETLLLVVEGVRTVDKVELVVVDGVQIDSAFQSLIKYLFPRAPTSKGQEVADPRQ